MAIIKLGEIISASRGNANIQKKDIINTGKINALHYGKTYKLDILYDDYNFFLKENFVIKHEFIKRGDLILISTSETIEDLGHCYYYSSSRKGLLGGEQIKIINNNEKILNKYLFYWFKKNKYLFSKYATGLKVHRFKINDFKMMDIYIPNIKIQQQIIDIIEPFESLKNNLNKQLEIFSKYSELIMTEYNILEKMNKKCKFIKGEMVSNFLEGQTLFLNVSAANNNPNKYCDNKPNIFPKDITISLDGNTGLVNNNLLGFNGYLYKVESNVIPNWQLYYSLKNKINQKIIKLNETGTTIKHSSNSKKELLLLEFVQKNILKNIFNIEINLKNQIKLIEKQVSKLISLLIK